MESVDILGPGKADPAHPMLRSTGRRSEGQTWKLQSDPKLEAEVRSSASRTLIDA
jgi:hypothetical protein